MRNINIYTDGSHLNKQSGHGRLGCGGVMVEDTGEGFGKLLDKFSKELLPADLERDYGSSEVSNPTAEMIGALDALRIFDIPKDAEVTMFADYQGVQAFNLGTWKCKEEYIKKIKDLTAQVIKEKHLEGRIKWAWVKGHQTKAVIKTNRDAYWNDQVDALAKGQ